MEEGAEEMIFLELAVFFICIGVVAGTVYMIADSVRLGKEIREMDREDRGK